MNRGSWNQIACLVFKFVSLFFPGLEVIKICTRVRDVAGGQRTTFHFESCFYVVLVYS